MGLGAMAEPEVHPVVSNFVDEGDQKRVGRQIPVYRDPVGLPRPRTEVARLRCPCRAYLKLKGVLLPKAYAVFQRGWRNMGSEGKTERGGFDTRRCKA